MSDNQGWEDRAADRRSADPPPVNASSPTYPTYPASASEWGTASQAPPEQPSTIRTAVRLMWAGAALTALSMLVTLLAGDSLESQVRRDILASDPTLTPADVDSFLSVIVAVAVVSSLIAILLWLWMAWKNGQGRRWARIVATVLGGFTLLSCLAAIASQPSGGLGLVLTLANLALAVVILVLLWSRPSSAFYDAVKRHRLT